jgi:Nucleotidyl transferase of unknown function (DUF2204)
MYTSANDLQVEHAGASIVLESTSPWPGIASERQIAVYHEVIQEGTGRNIPFAVGGSLGMAIYAGHVRSTKDLDLYVVPQHKDAMVAMLTELGLNDYYETNPYDRGWIYRATTDDIIVDVIWSMANRRTVVDEDWLTRGCEVEFAGERVKLIPKEELLWSKLYVLQRDRCDWPDILNLLDAAGAEFDWRRLLDRIGEDRSLLAAVLCIYSWLSPEGAAKLPQWLWLRTVRQAHRTMGAKEVSAQRAALLDSRPWLLSLMNGGKPQGC